MKAIFKSTAISLKPSSPADLLTWAMTTHSLARGAKFSGLLTMFILYKLCAKRKIGIVQAMKGWRIEDFKGAI